MAKYSVFGTVYYEYSVEVEAEDKDTAYEIAQGISLDGWEFNQKSGLDVYEVNLVTE